MTAAPPPPELQALLDELRHVRRMQGEILQLQAQILNAVKAPPAAPAPAAAAPAAPPAPAAAPDAEVPAVPRARQRRKTVLLVDDDPGTRQAAVQALEQVQVPLQVAEDGRAALAAITAQKPDVLVLELGLSGDPSGHDLVNTIKATMEWIDIRIVLHTREPIFSADEARAQHGADDLVLKGPGSAEALVNRVIALFQRK